MNELIPSNEFVAVASHSTAPRNRPLWFVLVAMAGVGIFTLGAWSASHSLQPPPSGPYTNQAAPAQTKIQVHVAGAVRKPGVYVLPFDARINDALQQAEPLPNADTNTLNLAAWAEDGSRIEVPFQSKSTPKVTTVPTAEPAPEIPPAAVHPTTTPPAPNKSFAPKTPPTSTININRATLDELTLLPGVGPALAERIVDYRKKNGAFGSVDDLDKVKGIGPKKLEKLRGFARVR